MQRRRLLNIFSDGICTKAPPSYDRDRPSLGASAGRHRQKSLSEIWDSVGAPVEKTGPFISTGGCFNCRYMSSTTSSCTSKCTYCIITTPKISGERWTVCFLTGETARRSWSATGDVLLVLLWQRCRQRPTKRLRQSIPSRSAIALRLVTVQSRCQPNLNSRVPGRNVQRHITDGQPEARDPLRSRREAVENYGLLTSVRAPSRR